MLLESKGGWCDWMRSDSTKCKELVLEVKGSNLFIYLFIIVRVQQVFDSKLSPNYSTMCEKRINTTGK